ncbi:MAG TPA: hypothetical protein VFC46_13880 [Humisphaera sp.]|nr:hypothetical protein [Humisphaera sp.]
MELPTQGIIGKRFLVIGVTCDGGEYDPSDTKRYPPDIFIPVPHAEDGSCPTTFMLPSAAYVEFVEGFAERELETTEGYLDDGLLDQLIVKIKSYISKQSKR